MDVQLEKTKYSNAIGQLDNQVVISDSPIPPTSFVWLICGKRGSGKTSVVFSLLDKKWRNKYDSIWLVSQTARNDSHSKEVLRDLIEELSSERKFFEDINEQVADEIITRIQEMNDAGETNEGRAQNNGTGGQGKLRHLLILDDCISSIPKNKLNSKINRFFINNRHYKLDTIVVTQKYNALSTLLRQNATIISMFANKNRKDINGIIDDLDIEPQLFKELYHFAVEDSPNHFLHINLLGQEPIFYKRFDKIILS